MVAGYHLIWTVYGYWLPNDPRGSTSREVRVELLRELGELHYRRKGVQPSSAEIRAFHKEAQDILKHPVLTFDDDEIALLVNALGNVIAEQGYTCYACAVMPDHVHLLIRRHRDKAETMIEWFQARSREALIAAERRSRVQPVWSDGPGWKTFVNSRKQFEAEVAYVRRYDGWMPAYRG